MKKKSFGVIIFFLVIGIGVVGLYYYFLTHKSDKGENLIEKKTAVEKLIDMDLDVYYPATVNTVMETYSKLCEAFYNEDYTDDEFKQLMSQYRKLLDEELLEKNPESSQLTLMTQDVEQFRKDKKNIISYRFIDDQSNKESEIDGRSYATVTLSIGVKKDASSVETTEENFILRKDSKGRWKILGWKLRNQGAKDNSATEKPSVSPSGK